VPHPENWERLHRFHGICQFCHIINHSETSAPANTRFSVYWKELGYGKRWYPALKQSLHTEKTLQWKSVGSSHVLGGVTWQYDDLGRQWKGGRRQGGLAGILEVRVLLSELCAVCRLKDWFERAESSWTFGLLNLQSLHLFSSLSDTSIVFIWPLNLQPYLINMSADLPYSFDRVCRNNMGIN